ncbi:MAG: response regulator transcription factor [Anaerolineae bacterium]|nr:response regulator transcription factor [Anaerolineae bacterium]
MQALLISQDPDEAAVLTLLLQRAGMVVERTRDITRGLERIVTHPADLIVLSAPAGSPVVPVRQIRARTEALLLVVGERLDEAEHATVLDAGADLVIERPFGARLLLAQIRALIRRSSGLPYFTLPSLSEGDLTLDPTTRTVDLKDRGIRHLTQLEFRLLYALMVYRGQVVPTEVLVEQVWGYTGEGERDLVRGLVRRLRTKIEPDPKTPQYVITIPGVGYTFEPQT